MGFIELPKFPIQSPDEKKLRLLWLRFLREIDEKTTHVSNDLLKIPEIAEAVTLAEEAAYTPGELSLYESYWDQVSREKTLVLDKYMEGIAEGRAEGRAEGEAKGKAEGITEGEAKGQNKERRNFVNRLIDKGKSDEEILDLTGIKLEELTKIKKDLGA